MSLDTLFAKRALIEQQAQDWKEVEELVWCLSARISDLELMSQVCYSCVQPLASFSFLFFVLGLPLVGA